jgi:low affinity Fe/Cu permease
VTNGEAMPAGEGPVERQRWLDGQRQQVDAKRRDEGWHRAVFRGSSAAPAHAAGWEERPWTSRVLHRMGAIAGQSLAGIVAAALIVVWVTIGAASGFPAWWQTVLYSVTGSVTFVMVFVIQHTQERQTSGTQRKLDELIRSSIHADNALIAVEEAADEHLQALGDLNLDDRRRASESSSA